MSAFGGKADMTVCGCLLLRSLLGVKRTWPVALHESAFDPKRTLDLCPTPLPPNLSIQSCWEAAASCGRGRSRRYAWKTTAPKTRRLTSDQNTRKGSNGAICY